jgi:hypothetical protein
MEEQLIKLGFVKYPDAVVMKPFRPYFIRHMKDGDPIEVTVKRGKIYKTEKTTISYERIKELIGPESF